MCQTCDFASYVAGSCWYALNTRFGEEERVHKNLLAWGVESFLPRVRSPRMVEGGLRDAGVPLFPTYLFARFDAATTLHAIRFTRGVRSVVSFDGVPAPVDAAIIELLRSRIGANGFVRIGGDLQPGDRVLIEDGPLRSLTGVLAREMPESERVVILLTTLGYQARACVARLQVTKLSGGSNGAIR